MMPMHMPAALSINSRSGNELDGRLVEKACATALKRLWLALPLLKGYEDTRIAVDAKDLLEVLELVDEMGLALDRAYHLNNMDGGLQDINVTNVIEPVLKKYKEQSFKDLKEKK